MSVCLLYPCRCRCRSVSENDSVCRRALADEMLSDCVFTLKMLSLTERCEICSILRRDSKFSGSAKTLESRALATPASGDGSTPQTAEDNENGHSAGGIRYPDDPTEEELESEWQIFLENDKIKHKHHDHADEGSAFKAVKAACKETGEARSATLSLHSRPLVASARSLCLTPFSFNFQFKSMNSLVYSGLFPMQS
jgi:hypothetical protein